MAYDKGDVFDGKYLIEGVCSDSGGMGRLLFVSAIKPKKGSLTNRLVLKYCKDTDKENIARFKREVRILSEFKNNSHVVELYDFNVKHDPPYFVMRYYEDGDLLTIAADCRADPEIAELVFLKMIDCVAELHARNEYHRDIKPQNFLRDGDDIVVSDLGLSTELGSTTAFTQSSAYWGTHGYIPPEFFQGGFKHADAAGDVFMLGKSFYVLLTGREPLYLVGDDVPPQLFHIIERCCAIEKSRRYQNLSELKQSLSAAFDVLLGRKGYLGQVKQLLSSIDDRLEQEQKFRSKEVKDLVEKLLLLEDDDQIRICHDVSARVFNILRQKPLVDMLDKFLDAYQKLVFKHDYGWSYAETIASNMKILFTGEHVPTKLKARALKIAIDAADAMHRFAAMDTCTNMITGIRDETLGLAVSDVIEEFKDTFIGDIEISQCESEAIREAIKNIKAK